ncbi:myocardial zonula adherens protein isoform X1 [Hemicordylus capensis]|uniref:myocardial zonula adherens protein isoform X1 n=1 Tax=Hemicordylus capensis TaxID=884348 RepID=UPI00230433C4|nr:myocardial zonula adherens protein isoform X1 [Hemicordylus capensis]
MGARGGGGGQGGPGSGGRRLAPHRAGLPALAWPEAGARPSAQGEQRGRPPPVRRSAGRAARPPQPAPSGPPPPISARPSAPARQQQQVTHRRAAAAAAAARRSPSLPKRRRRRRRRPEEQLELTPAEMLRYSSGLTLTTTTPRKPESSGGGARRKANVCRLRLTLPPDEGPQKGKNKTERTKKLYHVPNGLSSGNFSHGVVYGVVHRSDDNHNKEMVVYGWSANQLKEEMKYIRDVRLTLEKVRKKMYGEYDEMKRKIQELTNELTISNTQQESLQNHVQVHSAALDSFSEMNSSLTSASIELQKTLVDVTLENTVIRDQIKNLKQTHEESMEKLKEKQKQLETARVENELLKLKVDCSQEANVEIMREMTRKLYSQYEEKLQEEEQKHKLEKETLISETNRLLTAIEDANKRMRLTEMSLQEKDQRIGELDLFIQRMEEERHQLQEQLMEYEVQLHGANLHSQAGRQRSHQLQEVTASLRERIKHLDDMVLCQQKKVKHMVEEIELQKRKMKQKELFIYQLLEKISFLEGENKELQDRLDYLMEMQPRDDVETRDVGVGCDLPRSAESSSSSRVPPEVVKPTRTYTPFMRVLEYSSRHSPSRNLPDPGVPHK